MKRLIQRIDPRIILAVIGLMSSSNVLAIICPVNVNTFTLDVASQTLNVSGSGFKATYNGQNPVIMTYLALQTARPILVLSYTVDATSCIGGGAIKGVDI